MTDAVSNESETQASQTAQQETIQLSPEQMKDMRNIILNTVTEKYKEFCLFVKQVPIYQEAFHQSFLFFDTGMLWAKEAISQAPMYQVVAKENLNPDMPVGPPDQAIPVADTNPEAPIV